jgi:hypothetical protein
MSLKANPVYLSSTDVLPQVLELIHLGGERRSVPVEYATNTRLGFRWGMAGVYELIILSNKVIRAPMWRAFDRQEAIKIWMTMTGRSQEDLLAARYEKHMKGMPK